MRLILRQAQDNQRKKFFSYGIPDIALAKVDRSKQTFFISLHFLKIRYIKIMIFKKLKNMSIEKLLKYNKGNKYTKTIKSNSSFHIN
jgi:hypothetical protein